MAIVSTLNKFFFFFLRFKYYTDVFLVFLDTFFNNGLFQSHKFKSIYSLTRNHNKELFNFDTVTNYFIQTLISSNEIYFEDFARNNEAHESITNILTNLTAIVYNNACSVEYDFCIFIFIFFHYFNLNNHLFLKK